MNTYTDEELEVMNWGFEQRKEQNMGRGSSKAGRSMGGGVSSLQSRISREKSTLGLEQTMSFIRKEASYQKLDEDGRNKVEDLYDKKHKELKEKADREAKKDEGIWRAESHTRTRKGRQIWD